MGVLDWRRMLVLAAAGIVSGCAAGRIGGAADSGTAVTVTVRNPSATPVSVSLCEPTECSPFREITGEREADFTFVPSAGTRAVVTAKRGDRVVDQRPIDFEPGGRYRVVLDVP